MSRKLPPCNCRVCTTPNCYNRLVNIRISRHKWGPKKSCQITEDRALNIPNTTIDEMVEFVKKTVDSSGISVFNNCQVTVIRVRYKQNHRLQDKVVWLRFKGLSPSETKDLLLQHYAKD